MNEFEMPFGEEIRENGMWYLSVQKRGEEARTEEGVLMEPRKKGVKKMAKKECSLSMKLGLTLNLGNYQSARVDVGATVPTTEEDMDDKYDEMMTYISEKLNGEIEKIRAKKEEE